MADKKEEKYEHMDEKHGHSEHGHHHHKGGHKSHDHEMKHKCVSVQPNNRYDLLLIGLLTGMMMGAMLALLVASRRFWQTSHSLTGAGEEFIAEGRKKIESAVGSHHLAKQMRDLIDEVETVINETKNTR